MSSTALVKDYMTKNVVTITPDTRVAKAADLLREEDLRRLPVVENGHLVGLVTAGTMADATPSKATSLSIYEMNYLLNKTKIKDIMIKKVITVEPNASLEDAIYLMLHIKWVFCLFSMAKNLLVSLLTVMFIKPFSTSQDMV